MLTAAEISSAKEAFTKARDAIAEVKKASAVLKKAKAQANQARLEANATSTASKGPVGAARSAKAGAMASGNAAVGTLMDSAKTQLEAAIKAAASESAARATTLIKEAKDARKSIRDGLDAVAAYMRGSNP